jgi:NTP pyrophosphatase (non-canonical NTP hydrolase)
MRDALDEYQKDPTDEHLQKFKIEIGDELFAIICLANSKGIALDECFNLMMGKNRKRAQN